MPRHSRLQERRRPPRRGVLAILIVLAATLLAAEWFRPDSVLRDAVGQDPSGLWTRDFLDRLRSDATR